MEPKIVNKNKLTKTDCDKLLESIDMIEKYQNETSPSEHIEIPFSSMGAYGVSVADIKKLSEVIEKTNLVIKNRVGFDDELSKNSIFLRRLDTWSTREKIKTLKNELEEDSLIILYFEDNTLKRNKDGKVFICDFKFEKYPIDLIDKLKNSPKPLKRSELGDGKNNWARTVKEVNERTYNKLELLKKEPLIINKHGGYEINTDVYKVK
ncbi:MAG: hypothetical protein K9L98_02055 [Candidatus Pacebacteria bacterium]|nr:hypothetical protein [Candidatus Paceibacterota bacterium]MCF7862770.1 hypothetical protein [Candidatus Paceibacterota bacterium]